MVPIVRLAATVMLARDGDAGLEFLMVRRSARSSFAPEALVFPGGAVDPEDYDKDAFGWAQRFSKEFRMTVSPLLPCDEPPASLADGVALVAAAVRELREEASVDVPPSALHLFSHWITPPSEPKRFNTYFFIARAPDGARGRADAHETHDARWISPSAALREYAAHKIHLVYPTIKHLERATAFRSVQEIVGFAHDKAIVTIMPWGAPSEGFVLPHALEGAW